MPNERAEAAKVMREAIATRVLDAMTERQKSQREIGEILGLPQSAVSLRTSGKRPFRAEELAAIAEFLDTPIERFLPATEPAGDAA